jgi:hypothetical protein
VEGEFQLHFSVQQPDVRRRFHFVLQKTEKKVVIFSIYLITFVTRDSSVGIATRYELDGPGIEIGWGEIFRSHPDRPWGSHSLLYNGYRDIPGGKSAGPWC